MSLQRTVTQRALVYARIEPFVGDLLTGEHLQSLLTVLASCFPQATAGVLFDSTRHLVGQTLTPQMLWTLAWRLAANGRQLDDGQPVTPWSAQRAVEWAVVRVLRMDRFRTRDRPMLQLKLRVYTGSAATSTIVKRWSYGRVKYVSVLAGMARFRDRPYGYRVPQFLVNLYFEVELTPEHSRQQPDFQEVRCSAGLRSRNRREVLQLRYRQGLRCPREFEWPCQRCAVGYNECAASVHRDAYLLQQCVSCGEFAAIFDPELSLTACQRCAARAQGLEA